MTEAVWTNAEEFNRKLTEFTRDLLPAEIDLVIRKICLEILRMVVMNTPVDTGRARGNWQVTIGTPASDQIEVKDKSGQKTIVKNTGFLNKYAGSLAGTEVYFTNNVPYIIELEEGSSRQAPHGMVAVTFSYLNSNLFKAA